MTIELWQGIIALVVPLLICGVKLLIPKVPKALLPILAPVFGAGLEIVLYSAGASGAANPVAGAILGGLGVWLREVVDQLKKASAPPA